MIIAAIDPGKYTCAMAWAHSDTKQIFHVEYDTPSMLGVNGGGISHLWIEIPFVYPGARKEDPNDLIQVAKAAGQCIAHICPDNLHEIHPREWKGNIKKEIMLNRIEGLLSPEELALVNELKLPKTTRHNVIDSCGILLHALGRL